MPPDFLFEDQHRSAVPVCGVDEVGRGPLAGPVVAAAVTLNRQTLPQSLLEHINDSKKVTAKRRAWLHDALREYADISIAVVSVEDIDRLNILQASLLAMRQAIEGLKTAPTVALIDGNKAPAKLSCQAQTIIKGDSRSYSIAAASIIAKHHRDQLMNTYAIEFPQYGWESNAGYGTAHHLKAIEIHGVTRLHRRSFSPVSKHLVKVNSANN